MIVHPAPTRRRLLLAASSLSLAAPLIWTRRATAAQQLVVRTPGGAFDEVKKTTVYDPFREATGIEIVPVASTAAKLLAMFKAGQVDIDVIDTGDDVLLNLEQRRRAGTDALQGLQIHQSGRYRDRSVRRGLSGRLVRLCLPLGLQHHRLRRGQGAEELGRVLGRQGVSRHRMLADMASGAPNLEIALIADGVPMDKIYPIDIDRAFKSLSRIKPAVPKFWDTGALSAQMLADKEAVLAVLWSTRLQVAADGGAPVARNGTRIRCWPRPMALTKGTPNADGRREVHRLQPEPRGAGALVERLQGVPVNQKAYPSNAAAAGGPGDEAAVDRVEGIPQRYRLVGGEPRQGQRILEQVGSAMTRSSPCRPNGKGALELRRPDQALRRGACCRHDRCDDPARASSSRCSGRPGRARPPR